MASIRARQLRKNPTDAERRLWSRLHHRQLEGHRFRRQVPIGPFVVDFACLERRLLIEVDGGQHDLRQQYDVERTRWLESRGYRMLRFWNPDVLRRTDDVVESIQLALLESSTPTLALPLKGGGDRADA